MDIAPRAVRRRVALPIRVGLDPMKALLVASFKGDPEFESLEPQVFDDPVNGTGLRVLRYRRNGKVDVYWQPGVRVERSAITIGAGIGDFQETPMERARLEITKAALDVDVAFSDAQGRRVQLRVHENLSGKRGFPLLAPVGGDVARPTRLFLVYMTAIDLVRRAGSTVSARIGDRVLRPASLPILLGGRPVWFIRYAADPIIATLNPPSRAPVLVEVSAPGTAAADGMTIGTDGAGSVTRVTAGEGSHGVEMDFLAGLPNLLDLSDESSREGRWTLRISGDTITGGSYRVWRTGDRAEVALEVTDAWRPCGLPLSMRFFTWLVPSFRTWPATYRWRGVVELGAVPGMSGSWERVDRR